MPATVGPVVFSVHVSLSAPTPVLPEASTRPAALTVSA